jgi:hypothetical protein
VQSPDLSARSLFSGETRGMDSTPTLYHVSEERDIAVKPPNGPAVNFEEPPCLIVPQRANNDRHGRKCI